MSMFKTCFAACKISICLRMVETLTYPLAKEVDTLAVARFDLKQAIQQGTVQCNAVLQCRGQCTVAKPKPQ